LTKDSDSLAIKNREELFKKEEVHLKQKANGKGRLAQGGRCTRIKEILNSRGGGKRNRTL